VIKIKGNVVPGGGGEIKQAFGGQTRGKKPFGTPRHRGSLIAKCILKKQAGRAG
jgi:hypothetical protein